MKVSFVNLYIRCMTALTKQIVQSIELFALDAKTKCLTYGIHLLTKSIT